MEIKKKSGRRGGGGGGGGGRVGGRGRVGGIRLVVKEEFKFLKIQKNGWGRIFGGSERI